MYSIEAIINYISNHPILENFELPLEDDWEDLTVTAIALGLAPLLHWRLSQIGLQPPAMALAKLAVTRQAHARRNEAIAQQLAEILAACAGQNIKVIVLKGAVLAPLVYVEPALRPMNDIDLLFQPQDLSKTGRLLESLGYVGKHKRAAQGPGVVKHLSTYRRPGQAGSTPNPYLSAGGDRTIEPHGSLEESWFGLSVDITPGVWERARPISLSGQPAYRLSTHDMLLHLAVHAVFHVIMGASVFVQLYDISRVVDTWSRELNWPEFLQLTRAAKAQSFVYAGFYWAKTLYGTTISDAWLIELEQECSADLVSYIKSLDASGIFNRTQHAPLVTLKQRLRRGVLDRQEAARWADSLSDKWKVWQTALAFHRTDTANLLKSLTLWNLRPPS